MLTQQLTRSLLLEWEEAPGFTGNWSLQCQRPRVGRECAELSTGGGPSLALSSNMPGPAAVCTATQLRTCLVTWQIRHAQRCLPPPHTIPFCSTLGGSRHFLLLGPSILPGNLPSPYLPSQQSQAFQSQIVCINTWVGEMAGGSQHEAGGDRSSPYPISFLGLLLRYPRLKGIICWAGAT